MNPPRVYTCSPSWMPLPPPSLYHPSGSSQCTSPKHPVSCIESGLAICFIYDIIHVSIPFSQIIPPLPLPQTPKDCSIHLCLLLSRIQGYHYHLSKFHIFALVYCIGVFLSGLLHSIIFINYLGGIILQETGSSKNSCSLNWLFGPVSLANFRTFALLSKV